MVTLSLPQCYALVRVLATAHAAKPRDVAHLLHAAGANLDDLLEAYAALTTCLEAETPPLLTGERLERVGEHLATLAELNRQRAAWVFLVEAIVTDIDGEPGHLAGVVYADADGDEADARRRLAVGWGVSGLVVTLKRLDRRPDLDRWFPLQPPHALLLT